jgi:hypothetical protein
MPYSHGTEVCMYSQYIIITSSFACTQPHAIAIPPQHPLFSLFLSFAYKEEKIKKGAHTVDTGASVSLTKYQECEHVVTNVAIGII